MIDPLHPDPWDFHNTDKTLVAPDKRHRLVYYNLNEIAMGAPLGGPCFLEGNGEKVKINDWCGGPPVWEQESKSFAIPIWARTFSEGTIQKIGIVDLEHLELKIFEKTFRVLDLRFFEENMVSGFDSPIYNTETVSFDIETEKIETTIKLTI